MLRLDRKVFSLLPSRVGCLSQNSVNSDMCIRMCSNKVSKAPSVVQSMSVQTLQSIMKANELHKYQLVDVREIDELSYAKLKTEVINLPLSLGGQWSQQIKRGEILDPEKPVLCLCHHGVRSLRMANFLVENDFETVYNIEGGIAAFATDIDPSVGFY